MVAKEKVLPPGWRPRAVLFDCDGTLMDTEKCLRQAETELLLRHGVDIDGPLARQLFGLALLDKAAVIESVLGRTSPPRTALLADLHSAVEDAVGVHAEPIAGAREIVSLLVEHVPVGVVSNASRAILDLTLTAGGFTDEFTVTVAVDDTPRPKPAPDPYLTACALLGLPPADVLAFEDSVVGLESATSAGLPTIAVGAGHRPLDDPALMEYVRAYLA